jgi:hypothetical protein
MHLAHNHVVNFPSPDSFWARLVESSRDVGLPYGLSDIARELDIYPSAVQKWRDGDSLPYEKNLITLAKARGVNTEWLKTGRGDKLATGTMDAGTRELLSIWMKLPEDARTRLLNSARYERSANIPPDQGQLLDPPPSVMPFAERRRRPRRR